MPLRSRAREWLSSWSSSPPAVAPDAAGAKAEDEPKRAPASWTEYCHARLLGLVEQPSGLDKLRTRQIVEACGFRCPRILRTFDSAAELDFDGLPDAFVLKPSTLASRRGVMVLQRALGGRRFRELFRRRYVSLDDIKAEEAEWQDLWCKRGLEPFKLVVEEWVVGENGPGQIPFDYKLYTFGDAVKFIIQYDRNVSPTAVAFFTNEFESIEGSGYVDSTWKKISRGDPYVPKCWEEIVSAAKQISASLRTAFISVDAYSTQDGPIIGELTVVPGGPYYGAMFGFTPEFDAELGRCWEEASRKLGVPVPELPESTFHARKKPRMPHRLPKRNKDNPPGASQPPT